MGECEGREGDCPRSCAQEGSGEPAPSGALLLHQWCPMGSRRFYANYPCFAAAKRNLLAIAERDNNRIQFFNGNGQPCIFDPYGGWGSKEGEFNRPMGIALTNELCPYLVVCDSGNQRVGIFSMTTDRKGCGVVTPQFYFGNYIFKEPMGIEYDAGRGWIVVADAASSRVTMHDLGTGIFVGEMKAPSSCNSCPLLRPIDVAVDASAGLWYVSDESSIQVFEKNGKFVGRFGNDGCGNGIDQFNKPCGLCFDRDNNLLIADQGNNRIMCYRSYGKGKPAECADRVVTGEVYRPHGVCVNSCEQLVVTDSDPHNFVKLFQYK